MAINRTVSTDANGDETLSRGSVTVMVTISDPNNVLRNKDDCSNCDDFKLKIKPSPGSREIKPDSIIVTINKIGQQNRFTVTAPESGEPTWDITSFSFQVDDGDGVFRSSNLERAAGSPSRFVSYGKITNFLKTYAGSSSSDLEDAITSLGKKIPYVRLSALRTNSDPDLLKEVGYAQSLGDGGAGGLDLRSAIEGSCLEINSGGTTTVASEYERDKNPQKPF